MSSDMQRMKAWNLTKLSNENLGVPPNSGGMIVSDSHESLAMATKASGKQ